MQQEGRKDTEASLLRTKHVSPDFIDSQSPKRSQKCCKLLTQKLGLLKGTLPLTVFHGCDRRTAGTYREPQTA